MTDTRLRPRLSERGDGWLKRYYFSRAAFSICWVVAAFAFAGRLPALSALLLVLYPAWDALANLVDARRTGGLKNNRAHALNVAVSSLTTVAVAIALGQNMHAVLAVFGAWAFLAGLLQLAVGRRRWKTQGAQWAMILSGAQSALAGLFFIHQATGAKVPAISDIAPYAAFGAFYFLVSALWLTVSDVSRRKVATATEQDNAMAVDMPIDSLRKNGAMSGIPVALRFLAIGLIVVGAGCAFAYAAGWLTPARLGPAKIVDSLAPPGGPAKGFRRNHAKGMCFAGSFEANGAGVVLSRAPMFAAGTYPVVGRFNLAGPLPTMADGSARVRGMSLRIQEPDGQEWRSAMINAPFFPIATPQDFYALQLASANKADPTAVKRFAAAHPSLGAFGAWASIAPFTESYAEDRFNSLNSFVLTNMRGQDQTVRWSFIPEAEAVAVPVTELKSRDPDFLFKEIAGRVAGAPQKWRLELTIANPEDPTADPSKAWPEDRRKVEVGTLVVNRVEAEADGACRDINFDPTVLPAGMRTSDDPFPAARSAAYAVSYDRRTAEAHSYPHTPMESKP